MLFSKKNKKIQKAYVDFTSQNWLLEGPPCLAFFSVTYSRTFLEARCLLQPHRPCDYEVPPAKVFKLLLQEMSTGDSISCCPIQIIWAASVQDKVVFLVCRFQWNGPEKNPRAYVWVLLFPYHVPPRQSQALP